VFTSMRPRQFRRRSRTERNCPGHIFRHKRSNGFRCPRSGDGGKKGRVNISNLQSTFNLARLPVSTSHPATSFLWNFYTSLNKSAHLVRTC
jgi:hypothetical protein